MYLTLSAQTTIEFYGNRVKSFRARRRGEVWSNPYDQGMRRNWEQVSKPAQHSSRIAEGAFAVAQVFGTMHPLLSILPARRKPGAHASCLVYTTWHEMNFNQSRQLVAAWPPYPGEPSWRDPRVVVATHEPAVRV